MSATAILVVASLLGLVADARAVLALPVVLLTGFCFAAMAMVVTALARSYDFFLYYFTLVITPMLLLSGVFFPLEALPQAVVAGAWCLPLAHAVALVRPLVIGEWPGLVLVHLGVIAVYALAGLSLATWLLRRRIMK